GRPLPDELRGRPEARGRAGAGRPGRQGAHRAAEGRPDQPGGPARDAAPARPVRGALARPVRANDRTDRRHGGDPPMTVTALRKDPTTLTMTTEAEFEASPERVWQLWADPRQLERWWGPPTYPATFTRHDLTPGARVEYYMTGPDGDQSRGYWDVLEADAPHRLVFRDGFAQADGA